MGEAAPHGLRPYYETENVMLYHGDCMDVTVKYDLLLTDAPYGQNFVSNRRQKSFGSIIGDDDTDWVSQRLCVALRGLKRHRHVYIFGPEALVVGLPLSGVTELIWDKQAIGMGDLTLPWGPQHERITFATYEYSKANRERGYGGLSARLRKGSVLRSLRPNSARVQYHPTEKPVDILRQMIESSSLLGETVYDPFCGSGSTLVAALLEGRKSIGVEIEERYCEVAARRLEAGRAALREREG